MSIRKAEHDPKAKSTRELDAGIEFWGGDVAKVHKLATDEAALVK